MSTPPSSCSFRELSPDLPPVAPLAETLRDLPLLPALALAARAAGDRIVFPAEVLATILQHLEGSRAERGGLLLGDVHALPDSAGPYPFVTVVTSAVAADAVASGPVSLAMAASVWREGWRGMDEGQRVVGWYHSHPDLGVFFSGIDRRTQRAFFPAPYSVGLVVDWVRRASGIFTGAEASVFRDADGAPADPVFARKPADAGATQLTPERTDDYRVMEVSAGERGEK